MDPEIAALLGTAVDPAPEEEFSSLDGVLEEEVEEASGGNEGAAGADLGPTGFPEITKRFEPVPHSAFNDPNYYKAALSNESDSASRLHGLLQKYLTTRDPKDRGLFRQQIIPVFWDFLGGVARKAPGNLAAPKRFLLRFGILHPTFLDASARDLFSKLVVENELGQPVYYMDEWLKAVGTGVVKPSTTDEAPAGGGRSNAQAQLQQLMEKAKGRLDGARTMLRAKNDERANLEKALEERSGR
jgi:hypothetical protein